MADEEKPKIKGAKQGADAYLKSQGLGKDSSLGGMSDVPLSERKAVKVGKKGKKGKGRKNRQNAGGFDMGAYLMSQQGMQQQGMQAILDAYTKSQQKQPMIRRNMDGSIVDQTKQPEGLDYFKKNNPYTEEAQQRKRNVNAENAYQKQMGMFEGYNAVQAKKAEQAAMGNQDPNAVMSKTVGGQKFVFDKQGNPVGMTGDNRVNPEGGRLAGSGEALTRNAFVDAMTKGDSQPQASKPMAQSQTQSQPQAKPAYQLPTTQTSEPPVMAPQFMPLPQLPPGVPGQMFNFNQDGSLASEEQAWMNKQTQTPGQTAGNAFMSMLFGNPEKFKQPKATPGFQIPVQ